MKYQIFSGVLFFSIYSFCQTKSPHQLFISKYSTSEYLKMKFTFSEYSALEFYQNEKLLSGYQFSGVKQYSLQRVMPYKNIRVCDEAWVLRVYFLDDAYNNNFKCMNEIAVEI